MTIKKENFEKLNKELVLTQNTEVSNLYKDIEVYRVKTYENTRLIKNKSFLDLPDAEKYYNSKLKLLNRDLKAVLEYEAKKEKEYNIALPINQTLRDIYTDFQKYENTFEDKVLFNTIKKYLLWEAKRPEANTSLLFRIDLLLDELIAFRKLLTNENDIEEVRKMITKVRDICAILNIRITYENEKRK